MIKVGGMASVGGMINFGSIANVSGVINFGGMIKNPPPPNGLQGVSRSKNPLRKGGGFESHKQTVIASERSERCTSPQLRSSDSARKREWAQLRKQNLQLKQIVIASKSQDLRGNLYPQNAKHAFDKHNKIDCHDSTLRAKSCNDKKIDCHANANAFARNDDNFSYAKNTCHTERKRSISKLKNSNRDISRSRAQYDKEIFVIASERSERGNPHYDIDKVDCHANANAFVRNDGNANSFNDKNNGLPRATSCARNDGIVSHSLADLQTFCPPSLAEGVWGWVSLDSTADIVGKNSTSSLRPLQRNAWQSAKEFCHTERKRSISTYTKQSYFALTRSI